MDKIIMCGTDVHDRTLTSQFAVSSEEPRVSQNLNTKKGREKLFRLLKAAAKQYRASRIVLAYEASCLGFALHDECQASGIECYVLAPTGIRKTKKEIKQKDDKRDARMILQTLRGHLLAGNDLPSVWVPDLQTRDDREIIRGRVDAADTVTKTKTQIRMLLKRLGVKKPKEIGEAWTGKYRDWLHKLNLPNGARVRLDMALRELDFAEEQLRIWDGELLKLSGTDRYNQKFRALTKRIKGVGAVTGMVYLTEMGDLHRFRNRKQIGSYFGLTPCSNETGEEDDRKGRITKDGPARVRKVLNQAAWSRVLSDKQEAATFARNHRGDPKRRKIAIVAAMRRIGVLMWRTAIDAEERSAAGEEAA